ncbi:hypothetical protein ACIA8E_39580 [Streptomyces sp. NPDC051664]|uniref:hypothetical protein n=1 Tax=Streptomyces sp. NPDC051664 TaxID=3365668 RepID=UPI0037B69C38
MTASQGRVQDSVAALSSNYQGEDGHAYQQVMETWLGEVDRIKATCEAMENHLNESAAASGKANAGALEKLSHLITHGSVSDGVYSDLTN